MDFEKIKKVFEVNNAKYYRIEDLAKKHRARGVNMATPQAAFEHFKNALELIGEGKFTLVISDDASNSRGAVSYPFENNNSTNINNMAGLDIEQIKKDAYEAGLQSARWENMTERVAKLEARLQKFIEVVSEKFDSLENDNDADVMDKVESAMSAAELMKDRFKDFKV